MKRLVLAGILVLLVVASLVFAILNPSRVPLELAFASFSVPVGPALLCTFALGMLLGVLWRVSWVASLLGERGRLRRALRLAEAEARSAARSDAP